MPALDNCASREALAEVMRNIISYVPNRAEIRAYWINKDGGHEQVDLGITGELLYALVRKELTGEEDEE